MESIHTAVFPFDAEWSVVPDVIECAYDFFEIDTPMARRSKIPTSPGITEIEAGGGIFGDIQYKTVFGADLEYALTILATVTSRPTPTRIICDAGKKTMSNDSAVPEPVGIPNVKSVDLSAEHGTIELAEPGETPHLGDKFEFIAGYSDTTIFLHNELYGIRNGIVETAWPLLGRGRLQ